MYVYPLILVYIIVFLSMSIYDIYIVCIESGYNNCGIQCMIKFALFYHQLILCTGILSRTVL